MNLIQPLVIHTANILGSFSDPFEFAGDYGPEINPIRQKVFELVVEDQDGPTMSELIPPELVVELIKKQNELGLSHLEDILYFLDCYGDKKVFYFFRNCPPELLSLDKVLHDKASREGRSFDLPILGSTQSLKGRNSFELKKDLMDALFTKEILDLTKPWLTLDKDLEVFSSPEGQVFFYWAYQSLNLHLTSEFIDQINRVKDVFAQTIGDPKSRALTFRNKLLKANSGVVFTQETDLHTVEALKDSFFFTQTLQNGCLIFLRRDLWESDYELIPIENYKGRMTVILATQKTGQKFLLASCHGHSTKSEDGRLQISLVMKKFRELSNPNLRLLIGIDANTKTQKDVALFREHLNNLGLIATNMGPTTIKQRMVTVQHSKAKRIAMDEEDYLITLNNGYFSNPTIGFKTEKPNTFIPNIDNQSDHYPIGASLEEVR